MDERLHRRRGAGLSFLMGGDGEPLLLLHGVPGSSQTWQKVGIKIASRFRVILPDLMGFGASEPPTADMESQDYLEAHAKSVYALLNYLQIKSLYLGGHDFGAAVAVTLMRLYPEVDVRGLILSAANLFTDTKIPFPLGMARLPLFNQLFAWGMAGNRLGLRVLYESATQNKEEAIWRDFRRHLTGGSIPLTRRILQRSLADFESNYAEIEATLPHIICPTLVLWGDEDPFLSVHVGERVRAALPDAMLKVYAYTGHFVPEERPIESAEDIALRFTDEPLLIKA
jgi:pimeloyl-ACP methyl ester carboxylesterase